MRSWAKQNGHVIVGEYVDAGISGKKPPSKRPALSRFFGDIENGMKVDVLAFCKLDRFFRSVKLYYQAMDVLDRHRIAWQAIQEDYETISANGRLKLHLLLAVNEQEADRTSERIKVVFERKIANGECVNPNGLPLGYSCVDKRVVPDENAEAARAVFEYYARNGNKMGARNMLQNEYGINLPVLSINNMLHNPMYKGVYRGNQNYCEPLVSAELFDKIQDDLERRATRQTPSGVVYLFSGLIVCRECGKRMCAGIHYSTTRKIPYYRCPTHYMRKSCDNKTSVREYKIEQYLVSHLSELLANVEAEYTVQKKKVEKQKVNRKDILKKLDRLKDLYLDGLITKEQYKTDYDKFNLLLSKEPSPKHPRFDAVRKLIGANFEADYSSLSQSEKKQFWRAVLDHIEMDKDGNLFIYFRH